MADAQQLCDALRPVIDIAVGDTIRAFLNNSLQFHGDTGIMHYFYHRMMTHGSELLFAGCPNGVRALLLQSEQYTTLKYLQGGQTPSKGRLDFAVVDPNGVLPDGRVSVEAPLLIGFEVGRNKALDKMGEINAPCEEETTKPGDAVKLIRELRSGKMRTGYLLEFYTDQQFVGDAAYVFETVCAACNRLDVSGMHVLSVVRDNQGRGKVSLFPDAWRDRIQPGIGLAEPPPAPKPPPAPEPPPGLGLGVQPPPRRIRAICRRADTRELVVIVGYGDANCRVRPYTNGHVNPISRSFLVPTRHLTPQEIYDAQLYPAAGDLYIYKNRRIRICNGGPEQSRFRFVDQPDGDSHKDYNHCFSDIPPEAR